VYQDQTQQQQSDDPIVPDVFCDDFMITKFDANGVVISFRRSAPELLPMDDQELAQRLQGPENQAQLQAILSGQQQRPMKAEVHDMAHIRLTPQHAKLIAMVMFRHIAEIENALGFHFDIPVTTLDNMVNPISQDQWNGFWYGATPEQEQQPSVNGASDDGDKQSDPQIPQSSDVAQSGNVQSS
jgi:hypothetical protein